MFNLPLSEQTFQEYLEIQRIADSRVMDVWSILDCGRGYSSQKYYELRFYATSSDRVMAWVWKRKCVPKLNVFAWLLINNRLKHKGNDD